MPKSSKFWNWWCALDLWSSTPSAATMYEPEDVGDEDLDRTQELQQPGQADGFHFGANDVASVRRGSEARGQANAAKNMGA